MIELFDETYGKYYKIIGRLIEACIKEDFISEEKAREIIRENAFSPETEWVMMEAIKNEDWSVLEYDAEMKGLITPFMQRPAKLPPGDIERSWMKAVAADPRAGLFDLADNQLEDTEPLFGTDDYRVFDKVTDSDPYDDSQYRARFKLISDAIVSGYAVTVVYNDRKGNRIEADVIPKLLEYSEKDDKFRLIAVDGSARRIINLGRIIDCEYCSGKIVKDYAKEIETEKRVLCIELTDERNALERAATHFSQYKKTKIRRVGEDKYYIEYEYDEDMESEIVMQVIAFGSSVKAVAPQSVVDKIVERLSKQDLQAL